MKRQEFAAGPSGMVMAAAETLWRRHPKLARFLAIAIALTPLIVLTRWFAVIHGVFSYDDLDLLFLTRHIPLAQSLLMTHGDVVIPLFRAFFAGMYAVFGVNELGWNLYFLLLILAVNLTALAILTALGVGLRLSALFFLVAITSSVWNYTAVGYYSMSIYPQICLLALIGVLAIVLWRNGGSPHYKWLSLAASAMAPFIHPSGAYVPVAVGAFAWLSSFADPSARRSPLAMFGPDLRWLTVGLSAILVAFVVMLGVSLQGGTFLSMAHTPLTATAVAKSIYVLLSQGMALELLRPYLVKQILLAPFVHFVALLAAIVLIVMGLRRVGPEQRWTFLALLAPALINVLVVSFGRRLTGIDEVVMSAGKYNNNAYIWFSIATFYLVACVAPTVPALTRRRAMTTSTIVVGTAIVMHALLPSRSATEAKQRRMQRHDLLAVFADYADRTPGPIQIPNLDGAFIVPAHPQLHAYNLSYYRPFMAGFGERLTFLRNAAMSQWGEQWGAASTRAVPSLRGATDAAFFQALETDPKIRSLYLGGALLIQTGPRTDGPALRLDTLPIGDATLIARDEQSLMLETDGGATITLVADDWDPEHAHVLSLRLEAPASEGGLMIEVGFTGSRPYPYAPNRILLASTRNHLAVDLLQVYAYALNERVGRLTLRLPHAGRYTLSDVRLGR